MSETIAREGGCACGATRYRATGRPFNATICHCADCRRVAAAPAVAWFSLPVAGFEITRGVIHTFRSSPKVRRGFCPICGTPLTYAHDDLPDEIDITICSLDDPASMPPRDHVWTDNAVAWDGIDLPRHPRARPSDP